MEPDERLSRLASYLYAAVEAGRATKDDWQRWADRMIDAGVTRDWILDLSLARTKEQAVALLARLGPFDTDAALGHLAIRYLHFQLPLREFLRQAIESFYDTGINDFYDMMEHLDAGTPDSTIFAELAPRFAHKVDEAERQWRELFPEL